MNVSDVTEVSETRRELKSHCKAEQNKLVDGLGSRADGVQPSLYSYPLDALDLRPMGFRPSAHSN